MRTLFVSPVLWVVLVMLLIYNGFTFWVLLQFLNQPMAPEGSPMQFFLGGSMLFWVIVMAICAVIPMGTLAAEIRNGTLETLMTAPVTEIEVVVAKFLASWAFFTILWAPTLLYFFFLMHYGELDIWPVLSGYLGTLLIGGMYVAIGVMMSSLTSNQIIAAASSLGAYLILFLVALMAYLPTSGSGDAFTYLNIWDHMDDWARGLVDTRHIVYCVSIMFFALFCSVRALESRRWR
jgi:ABC-2 type transport system permease protein